MLESEMIEGQPEEIITILVDNPRVFNAAIDYLYTQHISLNEENAVDVLMCANQYNFTDLLHLAEDYLCANLQISSLEETGNFSFLHNPDLVSSEEPCFLLFQSTCTV